MNTRIATTVSHSLGDYWGDWGNLKHGLENIKVSVLNEHVRFAIWMKISIIVRDETRKISLMPEEFIRKYEYPR